MQVIHFREKRIEKDQFRGQVVKNTHFFNCDFSYADLTDSQFIDCLFYESKNQLSCNFKHAILKDASFKNCDLSMVDFRYANALGIEICGCRLQGADFRGVSFMNIVSPTIRFCSAYITKSNLSYANLSDVVLEKCELWENRWHGTHILGATFSGSDLSGGEFTAFDWYAANFTHCDLTNSILGEIDIRRVDFQGVKLESSQVAEIMEQLGIVVIG
ncbi:pentapeptide repeat-containing protein [Xenorhabdus stockiae]|uniref:Pentapeptide repeat-containing protein n=1 Tax=Xenorhabdus stockiae TaxID=351614 RepID=A0A2D0KRH1_9GAMM|nr:MULTISPECIES: Qnr family pentapeptide repeat protein [Xenorhabdus]PHM65842.1 pentapeptide repeat-containing protein [Xenorhabdus sp. KJ12.1]PHM65925.1 pentapeptide repeat-containing protein [Xenorhabdus stockiae]